MSETADKLVLLRKYLKKHELDGIVLGTRANFAWLSGGGDCHIVSQSENGFGMLVVTAKTAQVLATNIEIGRLTKEEPLAGFTAKSFPWIEPVADHLAKLAGDKAKLKSWVSDVPAATGLKPLPDDFVYECRAQLSEHEIRRYKALGRDCALAIETVARHLSPGDSEFQAESDLARHLLARGIQPYVLLVAFDERVLLHRHPTPTAKHLKKHAMLVVCGQRHGLIANLTRLVHFGPLGNELTAKHEAVCRIEAAMWEATVPGTPYGKALQAGIDQYKKEGFVKEWELHHQGGPTGYAGRDFLAVPGEKRPVLDRQAVAWNPSITGTKTEDTFILEGGKRTVITQSSPEWPMVSVVAPSGAKVVRPAILVR